VAWDKVPVLSGRMPRDKHWNEVIAAANERNAVTLGAGALGAVDAAGGRRIIRKPTLAAIRSRVEALVPLFYDPATGSAWTKAACLGAAIGQPDWTTPTISANRTIIRAPHINELRAVLDLLVWLRLAPNAVWNTAEARYPFMGTSFDSWAAAWADAKVQYDSSAWGLYGLDLAPQAGLRCASAHPAYYEKDAMHYRTPGVAWAVPVYPVGVLAAKVAFRVNGTPAAPMDFQYYSQISYGGTPVSFTVSAGPAVVVDVPLLPPGGANHSFKPATDKFSGSVLDLYEPPDVAGQWRACHIDQPRLLLQLDFAYHA